MGERISNALRATVAVGFGAAAVVGGAALAALDPATAVGMAGVAGGAAGNIGAGIIGGACHNGIKDGYATVSGLLTRAARDGRLPRNHDILRNLRRSHLNALQYLLIQYVEAAEPEDRQGRENFANPVGAWIRDELKQAEEDKYLADASFAALDAEYSALINTASDENGAELLGEIALSARGAAWKELIERFLVPDDFHPWFEGETGTGVGWLSAAHAFFAEKLKADERLRAAVFGERLQSISRGVAGLDALIKKRDAALAKRLKRLETALSRPHGLGPAEIEAISNGLFARIAAAVSLEEVSGKLDAVLDALAPKDTWAAYRAAFQSSQRHRELRVSFHGRSRELGELDAGVDGRASSVTLVTADAGAGKSALLAAWCDRRRALGDTVIQHLVATRYPATTNTVDALRHLAQQLRIHDQAHAGAGRHEVPETEGALLDLLAQRLARDEQEGGRLIVLVDGLDELAGIWTDRFVTTLGRNVHVVLSCRAPGKALPSPLARWGDSIGDDLTERPYRLVVPVLSEDDTLRWLEDYVGHLAGDEMKSLSRAIRATTDGLPVFIKLLLDDLKSSFPRLPDRDDRLEFVSNLPAPFAEYAKRQLDDIQQSLPELAIGIEVLFAILSKAMEPLDGRALGTIARRAELQERFGVVALPGTVALDQRIERWLDRQGVASGATLAFAHPKLALVFAEALSGQAMVAEEAIIAWADNDWKAAKVKAPAEARLYGLKHLPTHLRLAGREPESKSLLENQDFIAARLEGLGTMVAIEAMATDWRLLGSGGTHARFWLNRGQWSICLPAAGVIGVAAVQTLMGDLGLSNLGGWLATARPDLVPSSSATLVGHIDVVSGAMELSDGRILSWSWDAALRLWGGDGTPVEKLDGHAGAVWGALELSDGRILSWSKDSTLRLWVGDGTPVKTLDEHTDAVRGALELSDGRILSWSNDNTLRLWGSDGTPVKTLDGHTDAVWGALELSDGQILSWSDDRTLRLWGGDGTPVETLDGHTDEVWGALDLSDGRILSWSKDNTLRLWDRDGTPVKILDGHTDAVWGALELSDGRILSWSNDNTLRLWVRDGTPVKTLDGHTAKVRGALELSDGRVLSWSDDMTLRLWGPDGTPFETLDGHTGALMGALELSDGRILSWSWDTTLRLWDGDGTSVETLFGHTGFVSGGLVLSDGRILSWSWDTSLCLWGGADTPVKAPDEHTGGVLDTLELSDGQILSWSVDKTLRLWSGAGTPVRTLDGHTGVVSGALELSDGRVLSWSDDMTLRLWGPDGTPFETLDGHTAKVRGALELSDGRILSWSWDTTLRMWGGDGTPVEKLDGHAGAVMGALELSDQRILSWSNDNTLRLWVRDGKPVKTLDGHTDAVRGVLELSDGRILSWSNDNTLRLWGCDGTHIKTLDGHTSSVSGTMVLSDERILSWSNDNTLRLWGCDGTPVKTLDGHTSFVSGTMLLSDERILSWSNDSTLRLWGCDGTPVKTLEGHTHAVWGALELSNGRILSYSADNTLRMWNSDGVPMMIWIAPAGSIRMVLPLTGERLAVCCGRSLLVLKLPASLERPAMHNGVRPPA